ncbi:MAG: PAS domain-containing protein [Chloroflexota bacterium]
MSEDVAELLAEWRTAQRRFESLADADTSCPHAAAAVARAWLAYQLAVGGLDPDEVVLIVDDDRRYVAASPNAEQVLGVPHDQLLTMRVDDLTPPDALRALDDTWRDFLEGSSMAGEYGSDEGAGLSRVEFRARANWPVRHVHISHLKPLTTERQDHTADGTWRTVARSHTTIDSSRDLIRAVRGPEPQSIDSTDALTMSGRDRAPAKDAEEAS